MYRGGGGTGHDLLSVIGLWIVGFALHAGLGSSALICFHEIIVRWAKNKWGITPENFTLTWLMAGGPQIATASSHVSPEYSCALHPVLY